MSLPGAAKSVVKMLESQYELRHGALGAPTFSLVGPTGLQDGLRDVVTVFPYRVEQDPTRRHHEYPPLTPRGPRRSALVVDLRVLLTAWLNDAEGELLVLGRCMEILDQSPILSGPLLDASYTWDPDTALRVTLDHQTPEESFRLWDALAPSYRLSVPYIIRTIRLSPAEIAENPPVGSSTRVYVPAIPEDP